MSWAVLAVGAFFAILQWITYAGACADIVARCNSWVTSCKKRERVAQTRDSAVADLERILALNPRLGLLRRLGVIAPLLGVTLTAGSVLVGGALGSPILGMTMNASASQAPSSLVAVGPLFWGVCVGAALAMFNQLLVHRASVIEDELFRSAIEPRASGLFRDSDDRLDIVIRQVEAAGLLLGRSIVGVEQVLVKAQESMTQVHEAGLQAASSFTQFASGFEATLAVPVRSLKDAAAEMRGGAVEAANQFGVGVKSLVKQSAAIERSVSLMLERQESAVARQVVSAEAIAAAANSIDAMLAPLRSSAVGEFEQGLIAASAASTRLGAALAGAETQVAAAASTVPSALASFSSGLEAVTREERSRVATALADAVAEARKLADSIRSTSAIALEASNAGGAAIEELGRSIEALRTYTTEFASHMELLSRESERRVASDSSMGKAAQSTKAALDQFRTALSSADIAAIGPSAAQLNQSVRDMSDALTRAKADLDRQMLEAKGVFAASTRLEDAPSALSVSTSSPGAAHQVAPIAANDLGGAG
jgi:hypothetical protein